MCIWSITQRPLEQQTSFVFFFFFSFSRSHYICPRFINAKGPPHKRQQSLQGWNGVFVPHIMRTRYRIEYWTWHKKIHKLSWQRRRKTIDRHCLRYSGFSHCTRGALRERYILNITFFFESQRISLGKKLLAERWNPWHHRARGVFFFTSVRRAECMACRWREGVRIVEIEINLLSRSRPGLASRQKGWWKR